MGSQSSVSASGNKINSDALQLLRSGKRLTEMGRYVSPVKRNPIVHHLQIILKVETLVFVKVSYSKHGTEVSYHINRERLINQRQNNRVEENRRTNINSKRVYQFIIDNLNQPYHCVFWNCWSYGNRLWEYLEQSSTFDQQIQ